MKRRPTKKTLIIDLYQDPKYRGKHVIVVGGRVYAARTGRAKTRLLERLLEKYPEDTPTIAYIPKVDSLILRLDVLFSHFTTYFSPPATLTIK